MKHIIVILASLLIVVSVQAGTFKDDFEDGNLDGWGKVVNYTGGQSEWKVENGELICDRPKNWTCALLFGEKEWRNYTIECDAKMVKVYNTCQAVGFSFRVDGQTTNEVWCSVGRSACQTPAGWIEVWANDNPVKSSVKNFNFEVGRWYHLKGIAKGDDFEFYVDGELMASLTDSRYPTGYLALENNNVAHYDNVIITGDDVPDNTLSVSHQGKLANTWGTLKAK